MIAELVMPGRRVVYTLFPQREPGHDDPIKTA